MIGLKYSLTAAAAAVALAATGGILASGPCTAAATAADFAWCQVTGTRDTAYSRYGYVAAQYRMQCPGAAYTDVTLKIYRSGEPDGTPSLVAQATCTGTANTVCEIAARCQSGYWSVAVGSGEQLPEHSTPPSPQAPAVGADQGPWDVQGCAPFQPGVTLEAVYAS